MDEGVTGNVGHRGKDAVRRVICKTKASAGLG
jgi:hypothetical protein